MTTEPQTKILSYVSPEDFHGRTLELAEIFSLAGKNRPDGCALVSSGPGFGSSELLRQVFDRIFREKNAVMPVYFSFRRADRTAERTVKHFLYTLLVQAAAFRQRDPRFIKYSPSLDEITRLALPSDAAWIESIKSIIRTGKVADDDDTYVSSAFGTAVRAADTVPTFFIFDHLNEIEFLEDGDTLIRSLEEITDHSNANFVFSALRRSRIGFAHCRNIKLDALGHADSGRLIEHAARMLKISLSEQSRDLIATQAGGNPAAIVSLLRTASRSQTSLETFQGVQTAYTDEIVGGGMARRFDGILNDVSAKAEVQRDIVSILYDLFWSGAESMPRERWDSLSRLSDLASRGLNILNTRELIRLSPGRISAMSENSVLTDYVDARFRLEIGGANRALIVGDALTESLKRAPALMANFYRRTSAIGLRELLASFQMAEIPAALFDYERFAGEYKGAPDSEVLADLRLPQDTIRLPQIVQAVHTESLYKPISQVTERERSAVGRGFAGRRYADDEEIVWIAAEIDSKLEASRELADFWCDRLEMVALVCDFARYKIWLIAPEGFAPAALESLKSRNAIGSSARQVSLLRQYLKMASAAKDDIEREEYEIVVPMGGETELIAAHAVEEIAKRHNLDARSINQIKTALVEACINATEHSHSPNRKIYQKFTFDDEKITITISNRGLRLADRRVSTDEPTEGRRGWGLALMRRLMDEVKIEDVEDGTMISMTKYIPKPA